MKLAMTPEMMPDGTASDDIWYMEPGGMIHLNYSLFKGRTALEFVRGMEAALAYKTGEDITLFKDVVENMLASIDTRAMKNAFDGGFGTNPAREMPDGRQKNTEDYSVEAWSILDDATDGYEEGRYTEEQLEEAKRAFRSEPEIKWMAKLREHAPWLTNLAFRLRLGFTSLSQMAHGYGERYRAVKDFVFITEQMTTTSKEASVAASVIGHALQEYSKKNPDGYKLLGKLAVHSRLASYDPATHEPGLIDDPRVGEIDTMWAELDDAGRDLYMEMRDHYENARQEMRELIESQIRTEEDNPEAVEEALAKLDEMMRDSKGPYFPLKRPGQAHVIGMSREMAVIYHAVTKIRTRPREFSESDMTREEKDTLAQFRKMRLDPKHWRVEGADGITAARKRERALEKEMGAATSKVNAEELLRDTANVPDIDRIFGYFEGADMDENTKATIRDMLSQMYMDMMPSASGLKSEMHADLIAGASEDILRVFSDSAVSHSHRLSRLKHSRQFNMALMGAKGLADARGDDVANALGNELLKHSRLVYDDRPSPLTDNIMTASYMAFLGLNPSFWIINMGQVPLIHGALLAGRHGIPDTSRELGRAYKEVMKIIGEEVGASDSNAWAALSRLNFDFTKHFAPESVEFLALSHLRDRGLLDITLELDLVQAQRSASSGHTTDFNIPGARSKVSDAVNQMNMPIRVGEVINRAVATLAAVRLEKQKAESEGKWDNDLDTGFESRWAAVNAAVNLTEQTQINYATINKARHMQSVYGSRGLAKMLFQFRTYQQGMIYLYFSTIKKAFTGADQVDRKEAFKQVSYLSMMAMLSSGMRGLAFYGTLTWMVNTLAWVFMDDDEDWDLDVEMRNAFADIMGPELGNALYSGGVFGLMGTDISRRIGQGELLMPAPFIRTGDTARETFLEGIFGLMGASPAYALRVWEGAGQAMDGEFLKAAQSALPLKGGQNVLRAVERWQRGLETGGGETVFGPEEYDLWDTALQGLGFARIEDTLYYEKNAYVKNLQKRA